MVKIADPKNTPFFLTYRMEPQQPGLLSPELCQKFYRDSNDDELTHCLLLAEKNA
jgi:hypothetical protein